MTSDLLDEIKTKWNIPVTLPMSVPWGKDDVVWLVGEVERLRAEAKRADEEATKLANSGIATTEQLVRALRAENAALRVENARLRRGENARLRAAQSEDTPPTCEFCDKLRCACVKPEPDAFRRLRTCFEFDEDAPLEAVIKAVLQRFDGDLRLVAENARLREACTLALRVMEQKNRVNVPPLAKFITVDFAPEDVAVLRAALEKRP